MSARMNFYMASYLNHFPKYFLINYIKKQKKVSERKIFSYF